MAQVPPQLVSLSVPFCRVEGTIRPTAGSDIRFELWLPPASAWNGKYEGVGNGGFAGFITYEPMRWALEAGYAVSGTDTGHVASVVDARWALGHPEKVADFGWRAIHETAVASKAIVEAYYGRVPSHAYFAGCSDGGREALMEAQQFPEDYDGIVSVAPANYWTQVLAGAIWNEQALVAEPGGALTAKKLPTITAAALAACHAEDEILDNPHQCHFDPSVLLCKGAESDSCLTSQQITTLRKIYSGRQDAAGKSVFPGFEPGGEANPGGWAQWITGNGANPGEGSLQLAFGIGYFANMVFEKPDWDFRSINFDTDVELATAKTGQALNATDTNLERFKAAGGRLIQVHGWSDAALPPSVRSSIMKRWRRSRAACRKLSRSIGCLWPPACSIAAVALVRTRSAARLVFRHRRMMRRTTSCRRSGTGSRMGWRRRRSWPRNTRTMTHKKAS